VEALQGVELTRTNRPFGLTIISFLRRILSPLTRFRICFSGGFSGGETPVPIPNTEVKPFSADGTALATAWESRSSPGSYFLFYGP
jgi:hypothetical protein